MIRGRKTAVCLLLLAVSCGSGSGSGSGSGTDDPGLLDGVKVAVRGHSELRLPVRSGDVPIPVFGAEDGAPGICLAATIDRDTTRWTLRIGARSLMPVDRLGRTVCFALPSGDPSDPAAAGRHTVQATVVDAYDGRHAALPRWTFERRRDDRRRAELLDRFQAIVGARGDLSLGNLVRRLEAIDTEASQAGYPFLAMRTRLVRVYFLRRSGLPENRAAALRLLADRPAWLDGAHADVWAAQHAYERASLLLESDAPLGAIWSALTEAERRYRRVADPRRIAAVMKQADLLALSGSPGTGRARLADAVESCAALPDTCAPHLLGAARNTLAWLTLQDPRADPREIARVEASLRRTVDDLADSGEVLERANAAVNLAWARARLGRDPADGLRRVERWLSGRTGEPERRAWIAAWGELARATYALSTGNAAGALERCEDIAEDAATPDLAARGLACVAQAHRARGDRDAAAAALERAIFLDDWSAPSGARWREPAAPARRADRAYRAARLALERDRPEEAWARIAALDARPATADCGGLRDADRRDRWNRAVAELASLAGPASRDLRAQRDRILPLLKVRAQRLLRERWDCTLPRVATAEENVGATGFRAFLVDDAIVLLRRRATGRVEHVRTTPFDGADLRDRLARVEQAVLRRDLDPATWRRLTLPLARALVPDPDTLDPITAFALHGALQRIPLAALPLPARPDAVLADATLVVSRAGAGSGVPGSGPAAGAASHAGPPLFVVDPQGNLPAAARDLDGYRGAFPGATVLQREAATAAAVERALVDARWMHVDAHGVFDPAFPALAEVRLADGPVPAGTWIEAARGMVLANLSLCSAGRAPVQVGSGRFGVAGMFARNGVRWVIASRADLPDAVALAFNRRFYRALADGASVPEAYRSAHAAVRRSHDPLDWAPLILLEGQSAAPRTLDPMKTGRGERAPAEEPTNS